MLQHIQQILKTILVDRNWSWTIIAIGAILLGLVARQFILGDLLGKLRKKNRNWYKKTQKLYQPLSTIGWALFCLSITGFILIWQNETLFTNYLNAGYWLFIFGMLMLSAYIFHLRAYMRAMIEALHENLLSEKDIIPHAN